MNLIRLFAIALIIWIVYRLFIAGRWQARQHKSSQTESLVSCATCGVLIPHDDAIKQGADFYCCPEHQSKGNTP